MVALALRLGRRHPAILCQRGKEAGHVRGVQRPERSKIVDYSTPFSHGLDPKRIIRLADDGRCTVSSGEVGLVIPPACPPCAALRRVARVARGRPDASTGSARAGGRWKRSASRSAGTPPVPPSPRPSDPAY